MRRASSIDVAKAAGVSQATVSYVFSGRKGATVPAATRDNVLQVAKTLGYRPHRGAQSMKTGRTNVVAFWDVDIQSAFSTQVLQWIRAAVEKDGYELIISGSLATNSVSSWPVDGVLAFDSPWTVADIIEKQAPGIPIVSLGAFHLDTPDYVGVDLYSGARQAVHYLISEQQTDSDQRRIAYFTDRSSNVVVEQRRRAYDDEMISHGLAREYIELEGFNRTPAREAVIAYVNRLGCPDSIFCLNDDIAIGAQRGLQELGFKIPDDVAIFGVDGIIDGAFHYPSISTIEQPLQVVCATGWEFLKKRMQDPNCAPQHATFSASLSIRESTRPRKRL